MVSQTKVMTNLPNEVSIDNEETVCTLCSNCQACVSFQHIEQREKHLTIVLQVALRQNLFP